MFVLEVVLLLFSRTTLSNFFLEKIIIRSCNAKHVLIALTAKGVRYNRENVVAVSFSVSLILLVAVLELLL